MTNVVKVEWNQVALNDGTIFDYDGGQASTVRVVHRIKGFAVVNADGKIVKASNGQFEIYKSQLAAKKVMDYYNA